MKGQGPGGAWHFPEGQDPAQAQQAWLQYQQQAAQQQQAQQAQQQAQRQAFQQMTDMQTQQATALQQVTSTCAQLATSIQATQDAAAFMRSIAEARGRDNSALEATVLSAKAYSASEAVDLNVADLIAEDYSSLLVQLDRYEIDLGDRTVILNLSSAETLIVGKTFLERLLELVSDPNIAFLLVSLGGTGIIVELWNFGLWIPGTLGVLFLILGWAGIGLLPFSWAGVALMALGSPTPVAVDEAMHVFGRESGSVEVRSEPLRPLRGHLDFRI